MAKLNTANLEALKKAAPSLTTPAYDRAAIRPGMVHIGVGNFHRAHQGVFLDDALSFPGNEQWGYIGIGLMPGDAVAQTVLKEQDMMYTLWEKGVSSEKLRVIGCHQDFILAPSDPEAAQKVLSSSTTKVVTLTVTEKGYFINLSTGRLDTTNPAVAGDIASLKSGGGATALKTASGYLVAAARRRMAEGTGGFTVLSCDNVQENGCKARMSVLEMAEAVDGSIKAWIEKEVTFPNSMVDRITPATTDDMKAELKDKFGIIDGWPVVCESFLLWVVEDKFPYGRPDWDKSTSGKCIFVDDVVPYELMKLRLLNAVHQALSYPATLLGHELVHDAMADGRVSGFLKDYMTAAGRTVPPVNGLGQEEWKATVIERFSNPAIKDTIVRLTEDATNRIGVALAPCLAGDAVGPGEGLSESELGAIVLPVSCWIKCLVGAAGGEKLAGLNPRDDKASGLLPLASAAWEALGAGEAEAFLKSAFGEEAARPEVCDVLAKQLSILKALGIEAALIAAQLPAQDAPGAVLDPAPEGAVEMKVTLKKPRGFYVGAALSFLKGVEARPATDEKEATEAKAAVDNLRITGLGEACNVAMAAAAAVEADGAGSITRMQTDYPNISGRPCVQVLIDLKRN